MRLLSYLAAKRSARLPPFEKEVKFREARPLVLENAVSTKGQKSVGKNLYCCLLFFAFECMKNEITFHDFH